MKIYENILALREAVIEKDGKIVSITLDKSGDEELRKELDEVLHFHLVDLRSPDAPGSRFPSLFGILIKVAKECPTCGQSIVEKKERSGTCEHCACQTDFVCLNRNSEHYQKGCGSVKSGRCWCYVCAFEEAR